jgi:N-carbamoylputrescine amidase
MRVALVQQANSADREANLATSIRGIEEAAAQGAELVLLQELHAGLYFCQTEDADVFDQAEALDGPTVGILAEQAYKHGLVIVGSIFERRAAGIYHNTAVVLERDGSVAGIYRKMHIPDDPGYYEKFYFTPGDLGFEPIDTSVGRLGVLVCWDQWYPEAARLMALAGAELLLYPTAIGWHPEEPEDEHARQLDAWRLVQRGHAVANGLPLLACNRVGPESDPTGTLADAQFWGASFVCGPQGELLAEAPTDAPCVLMADIDMQRSERVRRMWPFLRDRRIDDYDEILLRYRD